ncbi:Rieske (2Fe-2S) protein [Micromonospora sp. NPDC049230]|uniref:Rieske (2Fe-2S) protein n=1 Tax=Micromonospora sp. NPDC049230 TaxID=3155502 RepID=UPI0033F05B3D
MARLVAVEHRLGPVDEIPVGEGRAYAVGDDMIAIFRLRDGGLRAVSAVCPHAGGPLADGLVDMTVVVCPLHQNTFELATGCSTTGQPPLTVYPVRVDDDGRLVVGLPPA